MLGDTDDSNERLERLQQQLNRVSEDVNSLQDWPRVDNLRKLPRFVSNDSAFWFMQIKSVFNYHRITTEAHHVIADLYPENIFTQIKNQLISTYSVSTETRLRQLLKADISTDGKPSLILTRLRSLGDAHCSEEVIKSVFLNQLLASSRAILAASNVMDLQELANLANKVFEASNIASSCSTVNMTSATSNLQTASVLESQIRELSAQVNALSTQLSRSNDNRSRSRSRNNHKYDRGRSSSSSGKPNCWYHHKFGKNATKCKQPCSFSTNTNNNKNSGN